MSSPSPSDDGDWEESKEQSKKKRNPPAEPRKLMRWNPDADQFVLLCIDAVCSRLGVALPWDEIAKEVEPWLSAEGIKQHLGKLRLAREALGRKVPPKPEKGIRRKSRAKEIKGEEDAEADDAKTAKNTNKLASLLYHGPETAPKKVRTPKKPKEATTPGGSTGAGRKKTKSTLNREAILGTPTKSTGSATGKRGRKGRAESLQEDDDDDYQENTPSKKQKSYGLRPITNEPKYTQEMAAGEGDEDDESLLAPEDDGDYEYQEDGIGENDDMEGVQEQKASSQKSDTVAATSLPAPFSLTKESVAVEPKLYAAPSMYHGSPQHSETQYNPLAAQPGYNMGIYGSPGNMHQDQDPFFFNSTPHSMPTSNWEQFSGIIRPEESAMRSSLNKTPRVIQREEPTSSEKSGEKDKKPRKDSKREIPQTPVKKKGPNNGHASSPVSKFVGSGNRLSRPFGSAQGSPFDSAQQTQADIDAACDVNADMGQINYTTAMPLRNMNSTNYTNGYGTSVEHPNIPDFGYMYGNDFVHANIAVSTNANPIYTGQNMVTSPHQDYLVSADANLRSQVNFNGKIEVDYQNMNAMPNTNISGFSAQQFSQNSGLMPTPTHSNSFDSMGTTVPGSQTDEANQHLNFDGGDDSQFFEDALNEEMFGGNLEDPFGGRGM